MISSRTSDLVSEIHDTISKIRSRNGLSHTPETSQETVISLADICRRSETEAVFFAYKAVFGRLPDQKGFHTYVTALRNGTLNRSQFLERLMRSPEAQTRRVRILHDATEAEMAAIGSVDVERSLYTANEFAINDVSEFLCFAYQAILKRAPDSGGLENYRQAIAGGTSREQVLRWILDSDEHRSRTEQVVILGISPTETVFKELFTKVDRMASTILDLEFQLHTAKNGQDGTGK